jgi:predicted transcriptional regulator
VKKAINIRLDDSMIAEMDEIAGELDKTRTWIIETAVTNFMDKLDEMVADKRIDELKKGKSNLIPLEEVFAKAGITA